jgi:hypothetical protein
MVRSEAFPFENFASATAGQLTWVYLNQLIDYDERVRKIHVHCRSKFFQDKCEVCGEPIGNIRALPPELQDKVYRPGVDESYHVDLKFEGTQSNAREVQVGDDDGEE